MSAEGQTIPDDIWEAARALRNAVNWNSNSSVEIIARALLAERERNVQPRKKIIEAMCELPHSINDDRVEFRFNPRRPGRNALDQLITQLEVQFGASPEEA
ncbi:hypothetical protein [Ensifer sp. Root278]|uniref:hypothetical protein n=1 Tax=Ensifer sp. Root278 TaxID=1736509 RepID=UPI0007096A49|nr:hypothetical protein [Ensifer sp. Root278]KRD56510.1 hypothetical protein ASE60_08625 [Ensifer sp. Root278]